MFEVINVPGRFTPCAYEVKNDCCLFERRFKVKKNGVFLFLEYLFCLRDIHFFVVRKYGSDDVIGGSTKTTQHSIEKILEILKQVLAPAI